ncbi:MAG: hypothetical protein ACRDRG_19460 [Pseudonocardiaceae bacterium]
MIDVLDDPPALVLADLGTEATLADQLLYSTPDAASRAVQSWAEALGTFQSQTSGLQEPFRAHLERLSPLGARPTDTMTDRLVPAIPVKSALVAGDPTGHR